MDDVYVASPVVALTVSVILQMLKNTEMFPFISRQTGKLNAIISAAIALASALVISVTFDMHTGDFSMSGNVWDILDVLKHWAAQLAEQHGFYKLFIALPEAAGENRAISREILAVMKALSPPAMPPIEKPKDVIP